MGYVDAAIGVKTGLNYNENKNRLGSFTPPLKVFLDRSLLKTLPMRHILNGVCEILKLAVIKDQELFNALEAYGAACADLYFQCEDGDHILDLAIASMLDELEPDFFEENLARKVDFGHTFSYGLETRFEGRLFHGEAVLLDVALSTIMAKGRGLLSQQDTNRIFHLIEKLGLHLDTDILDPQLLWQSLEERVYHRNGLQRIPMPHGIGNHVFLNDVTEDEIKTTVNVLEEWVAVKNDVI
jgi:3-dehydroquinate synthetase